MAGTFVVLEGSAGTGKSTLLDALAAELERRGRAVATVPEFADAEIGEFLDREIAECSRDEFRERALSHLAANLANVAYQAETVVGPALERHDVVIAERFVHTTAVYSLPYAEARDLAMDGVVDTFADALPISPDLTILLTLDEDVRRERLEVDRPELLDDGEVPERVRERQRRYRDRLAGRDDVLVYENDGDVAGAVADLASAVDDVVSTADDGVSTADDAASTVDDIVGESR